VITLECHRMIGQASIREASWRVALLAIRTIVGVTRCCVAIGAIGVDLLLKVGIGVATGTRRLSVPAHQFYRVRDHVHRLPRFGRLVAGEVLHS